MRLKSVWISEYKNLRDFSFSFNGESFIDIFVGKNGSGKSNFLEAILEIFKHISDSKTRLAEIGFCYEIAYEIDGKETKVSLKEAETSDATEDWVFKINDKVRKTVGKTPSPEHILIYYSGHNSKIHTTIAHYSEAFARESRSWTTGTTRKFIGIQSDYKEMLLTILLMQPGTCRARQYLCEKLQIDAVAKASFSLTLKRPPFATTVEIDVADRSTFLWAAEGAILEFLQKLTDCINGGFTMGGIYDRDKDQYKIPIDIDKFREVFADTTAPELFRSFDQLKAIGMLESLTVPIHRQPSSVVKVGDFSDGQFQSVYIFAISELFKDRNCITLLDEPDSFLHPEWQFDFLKQVEDISTSEAAQTNHVIMCSHSASTIAKIETEEINSFEINGENVNVQSRDKAHILKSLSAGLITWSREEATLDIHEKIENTTGPIIFTEGPSDKIILDAAIQKLFPGEEPNITVIGTYGRQFLRNFFSESTLRVAHPNKKMFALFDFDEAYNDWHSLTKSNSTHIQTDPYLGLTSALNGSNLQVMLLPVPRCDTLKTLALSPDNTPFDVSEPKLSIEHLFCDIKNPGENYSFLPTLGGGRIVEFKGNKISFAKEISRYTDPSRFECFRWLLEHIKNS